MTTGSVSAEDTPTPPVVNTTTDPLPQTQSQAFEEPAPDQPVLDHPPPAEIVLEGEFPVDRLTKLDEQLSRPKWVVPVRPRDDLEMLLRHAIKLCKEGMCMMNVSIYVYVC